MESFLSDLGGLIAAQEDLTIAEIIGGLEITKAELLAKIIDAKAPSCPSPGRIYEGLSRQQDRYYINTGC